MASESQIVSVVVRGDAFSLRDFAGAGLGGVTQMVPAATRIETMVEQALQAQPNLELARQLRQMLDEGRLYQVVGRWPDDETAKPVTQVQGPWPDEHPGPGVCPKCGQALP